MANKNVRFFMVDLKSKYDALVEKDPLALYWIEETKELYKGGTLFGTGAMASEKAAGLLSTEDYIKLKELIATAGTISLEPVDASIVMADGKIGVQLSKVDGNGLELKADGLYAVKAEPIVIPEYTLEKQAEPSIGSVATYKLKKIVGEEVTYVGDAIELGKEIMLKGGSLEEVVENGVPYAEAEIGDKYLDLVLNDEESSHIYVPVNGLVDDVKAGHGVEVVNNTVSIKLSPVEGNALVIAEDGGLFVPQCDFTAVEKAVLDSISDVYATKELVKETVMQVKYEISSKPEGALVNYGEKEIRVMCPADTKWVKQSVGGTGNANMYYMGFKAYAPEGAVSFKEGDRGVIVDKMFTFDDDFAGTDEYGRNYSIVWLALASYDAASDTWNYFGKNSSAERYIGWDYCVEWYDQNGVCMQYDSIRINLSNEDCHTNTLPYFMSKYATKDDIASIEEGMLWGEL